MAYRPRRLRKPRGPAWALTTRGPITREQAEAIKRAWRTAQRTQGPLVLDGTMLDVRRLR
jgi:hypothetical protein